jgi:hypothetical protein
MTPNDSVALSQILSVQASGRLPLSTALYACSEVARLVAGEHDKSRTVNALDVDHIRCTRSGAVVLEGARVQQADAEDAREDVHAVGSVFYRLLTGKAPSAKDVVAPSHFNPGVDSELDAVILASLASDASLRPASVRVLEGALAAVFEELELTPTADELAQVVRSVPAKKTPSGVGAKPAAVAAAKPAAAAAKPAAAVARKSVPTVSKASAAKAISKPMIVATPRRPPAAWYSGDEDEEEVVSSSSVGPSWQTQERERKWMVGLTVAMIAVALLWALWPSAKPTSALLDDTPPARVSAHR